MRRQASRRTAAVLLGLAVAGVTGLGPLTASPEETQAATTLRSDLRTTVLLSSLSNPVAARVAPDGRIFTADKVGVLRVYDDPGDTTPRVVLDIKTETHSTGDRGLIGLALDPAFASGRPYVYVLYTQNKDPFGTDAVPRWFTTGNQDQCPNPPGLSTDGCTATARLARYTVSPDGSIDPASRRLLIDGVTDPLGGYCYQFPSHNVGTLQFGSDGMLYAGSGEGANFSGVDWGQFGGSLAGTPTPANPCNDRDGSRGTAPTKVGSRGGALRAQSVRDAPADGYVSYNGAILRIDPDTGAAPPSNPLVGNGVAGDDRIVAYGMRNPFRFNVRPGTNELWIGDVGWQDWEEINVVPSGPAQTTVPNLGWPCYEGSARESGYDAANLGACESLYSNPVSSLGGVSSPLTPPLYEWNHADVPRPVEGCGSSGGGSVVGGTFLLGNQWPADLRGGYVFADYVRGCIAVMRAGADGNPDPTQVTALATGVVPVDIQRDGEGNIYWVDRMDNSITMLSPQVGGNRDPVPAFTVTGLGGDAPDDVVLDATGTMDPDAGDVLTYTWDLDGDGACDDAAGVTVDHTLTQAGSHTVKLCVTDDHGGTATTSRTLVVGVQAPVITALTTNNPLAGWGVGTTLRFTASATEADGTPLPSGAHGWEIDLRHCTTEAEDTCHTHPLDSSTGSVATLVGPDHDYYAYLRGRVTVTSANGTTATATIDARPRTSTFTLATNPKGIQVTNGGTTGLSPVTQKYLYKGLVQLFVPPTAVVNGVSYRFSHWADDRSTSTSRTLPAPGGTPTRTAVYVRADASPVITDVTVSPGTVRRGGSVTVTARLRDDHGITWARARLTSPGGKHYAADMVLDSGTVTDGIWSAVVRIPTSAVTGTYVSWVMGRDTAGVQRGVAGPGVTVTQ